MAYKKHPVELLGDAYLRVYTPKTSDGRTPKIVNGIQQFREDHLPLTARKHIERKNRKLPEVLQKKIEIVNADIPVMQRNVVNPPATTGPIQGPVSIGSADMDKTVPAKLVQEPNPQTLGPEKPTKPVKFPKAKKAKPKKAAKVKPAEAEKPLI